MGHSHSWKTVLPAADAARIILAVDSVVAPILEIGFERNDYPDAIVFHDKSGQAESFTLGQSESPDQNEEFCKTDRGLPEVQICEAVWRSLLAINDAGGHMQITSDWLSAPLQDRQTLDTDCALALAILVHRCSDAIEGRSLSIKAVPRPWPLIGQFVNTITAIRQMETFAKRRNGDICVVFGAQSDGEPDFNSTPEYGTPQFMSSMFTHCTAEAMNFGNGVRPTLLRGMLLNDVHVVIDGKSVCKEPHDFMDHPEVVKRTVDLMPLIPSLQWLEQEVADRTGGGRHE